MAEMIKNNIDMQKQVNDPELICASAHTDSHFTMHLKDLLYPVLMLMTRTKVKCTINPVNAYIPLPNRPIIFAANHSAFMDTPIMERVTKRRSYILAGKQRLPFDDRLFFHLAGVIWVDRKSRTDTKIARDCVAAYLMKGRSVLWFPEGTWNLTDNQIIMPLKWGITEVAKQTNAQIIPTALHYDREENICSVKFGTPYIVQPEMDKTTAIRNLRDFMATLSWDLMSQAKQWHHEDITGFRKQSHYAVNEYPYYEEKYEQSCIFSPYENCETIFSHLGLIKPSIDNAALFSKNAHFY